MYSTLLSLASLVLYGAATWRLASVMRAGRGPRNPPALFLALGAALAQAVLLYGLIFTPGGLDLGFFHALSLGVWVLVALLLGLASVHPIDNLGIGLFPLAGLVVLLDLAFGTGQAGPTIPTTSQGLGIHVLVSICAHAVLGLATMQAVLLGFQHHRLHDHQPTRVLRALPPLYVMETMLFRMIAIGFGLLTLALASGFVYLENMFAQQLVHKTVLTLAAWVLFGVLLAGHHFVGWRGPTAVRFTVGGFILLVLGYFGSKLVLELILARS